jgi:hypothetical protein
MRCPSWPIRLKFHDAHNNPGTSLVRPLPTSADLCRPETSGAIGGAGRWCRTRNVGSVWRLTSFFVRPFVDLSSCVEQLMDGPHGNRGLAIALASLVVTWFVYVPIHELLHVAGCLVTGGSVSELEIQAIYGGALLARFFDFVTVGGEYAGRLSGFDTHGSDLVYLATDFGPYILSVVIGVPLMQICAKRRRPLLFGPAIVLGLAPILNILGDYYEMASVLVTRAARFLLSEGALPAFEALRADDLILLIGRFVSSPADLGLTSTGEGWLGGLIIGVSTVGAVILAFATYALGGAFARIRVGGAGAVDE